MSGYLAGQVWRSNLDSNLKPLAACLADFGNDDGSGIYPSNAYLQWLLGWAESTVRAGISALRKSEILVPVTSVKGGRGKVPTYRIDVSKLPPRPSWQELKGTKLGPITQTKGPESSAFTDERGQNLTLKGPDSDSANKDEPSENRQFSAPTSQEGGSKPSKPKKTIDPRHVEFKDLIFRCYRYLNDDEPPWDGSDAKQLDLILKATPNLAASQFHHWLNNYANSEINPADRPRGFLPKITSYASGPLDRFMKPREEVKTGWNAR